ncbi:MAG TPA: nucleotidyltransferase domain-containing protein [Polyangiaceae bacterium]|nr:nucleotidyltransferase domain-containing protein [Polyangiaceae bacterium]
MSTPAIAIDLLLKWSGMATRRVDAIWLFGSHASDSAGPDSDVDLAVLCEPPLTLDRARAMDELGRALGGDIDIIDLATATPPLRWEIITTGRLLFERDEELVERYVRRARHDAEDAEQLDRMALLASVDNVGGARR